MAIGRSIRIYLDGGEVSGIRHAELVNWTGQALLCPRSRLGELVTWEAESRRPGVYFLFEAEDMTSRKVYVGESESGDGAQGHHAHGGRGVLVSARYATRGPRALTGVPAQQVPGLPAGALRAGDERELLCWTSSAR